MELPLERFHQLGNTILVARKHEDYRARQIQGFLAYTIYAVNAGKKAPSPSEYFSKQKLDDRPELEYLWEVKQPPKQAELGSADKAAAQLKAIDRKVPEENEVPEGLTPEQAEMERRKEVADEWGTMSVSDLQAYKAKKNRGL